MQKIAFFLFSIFIIYYPSSAIAGINLPWTTTYACPEWLQYSDPLNCDGISRKGSWTASPGNYYEQIIAAANHPAGAGGNGQRHWVGDGTNNNSGSIQINFNASQSRFWIRWYQRWQAGFSSSWDTFKNVWFEANTGSRIVFHTGRPGIGGIDLNPPDPTTEINGVAYGSSFYQSGTSDGSWHAFEVFLDLPNNTWRVWIDGNLITESSSVDFAGATSVDYIILPENMKNVVNGQPMYIDFDDISITNTTPSQVDDFGNPFIGLLGAPTGGTSDNTAPTVSISSPSDGSTVSGTVSLSASASDNTGIAGVQFQVDDVNQDSEDTSPPYSISINTANLADGPHSVSAIARDAAGNQQKSVPVTITVSNGGAAPPPGGTILFTESFEDTGFASRGWYDNTAGQVIDSGEFAPVNNSTASAKYHFASGATVPDSGSAVRHTFTPTEELFISYYVKYSPGYQGSGYSAHPHEFFIMSDLDGDWASPNYSYLQFKIEQSALKPRIIFRDDKFVNTSYGTPPIDLVGVTEDRAVNGCNGEQDSIATDCYQSGNWYNSKHILHDSPLFTTGTWHKVDVYLKLNTVTGSTTNTDGVLQYWLDDALVFDYNTLVMRTSARPTIRFNQIGIAPYIGQGSPVDQTMWVDELKIYDGKPDVSLPSNLSQPADFRIL